MHRLRMIAAAGVLAALALAGCASIESVLPSLGSASPAQATTCAAAETLYTSAVNGGEIPWLQLSTTTKAQATVAKSVEGAVYADIVVCRTATANGDSPAIATALALFNQAYPAFLEKIGKGGGS